MGSFDPRVTPARRDLAASFLRGQIEAERFVEGVAQEVVNAIAPVRRMPSHGAALDTEALRGERVTVYETDDEGWAWAQLDSDRYVGWLPMASLLTPGPAPTHRVTALRTFVFPEASIKAPPLDALPLGATVRIEREQGPFAVSTHGYLTARHLAPLTSVEPDFVAVAERFAGAPYLWGGKTSLGIDCSGLVQVSLNACGIQSPRDSDMQEAGLGSPSDLTDLRRGDLVFWKGHVAIASDAATLVHANAFHMQVAIEPAAEAIARIRAGGSEVTSVRRLATGR